MGTRVYTAHELAAMPLSKARLALVAQECAHMQQHHARRLLNEIGDSWFWFEVGRVECAGIEDRRFQWRAHEACGICANTGEVMGDDEKGYDCPVCADLECGPFETDYDGNLITEGGGK